MAVSTTLAVLKTLELTKLDIKIQFCFTLCFKYLNVDYTRLKIQTNVKTPIYEMYKVTNLMLYNNLNSTTISHKNIL